MKDMKAFDKGFEAKRLEITEMGMDAAIAKLNMDYPLGQPFKGTLAAQSYMNGEVKAIEHCLNRH